MCGNVFEMDKKGTVDQEKNSQVPTSSGMCVGVVNYTCSFSDLAPHSHIESGSSANTQLKSLYFMLLKGYIFLI